MLHKLMDMHVFFYGMIVSGAVGALEMFIVHLTYRRRLKNTSHLSNLREKWLTLWKSRDRLSRKMNRWVWYPSLFCVFFMGAQVFLASKLSMEEGVSLVYFYVGAGIPLCLLLFRQFLDFSYKEELMVDTLADYIDQGRKKQEQTAVVVEDPAIQDVMVDQIARSIRETAAAGSRFSRLLAAEEEELMRESIREFMDQ